MVIVRIPLLALVVLLSAPALLAQIVRSAAGATPADITAARDLFRLDIGGGTTAGANGSFGGLRREINWDGVPDAFAAPNNLPANFFNTTSPRGAVFSTPGTGFQVSSDDTQIEFDNINPTYSSQFQPFSPLRLFTPLGSNITDVTFFVPGTAVPAAVSAFGAVFTDVDVSSTIQFFDLASQSLGIFQVPVSPSGGLSFLGVSGFPAGALISRVRITTGNVALGAGTNDTSIADVVVLDDFIYSEPIADGILVENADVAVDKVGPATVTTGVPFNYTITVTNAGPGVATNVVVNDTLPAGLTATSVVTTQGSCIGTTTITCTVGSMNSGATPVVITITTSIPSAGVFSNSATISATPPDPTPANNIDTVRTTATAPPDPGIPIPTAGTWALIVMSCALVAGAVLRLR